jgi:hypothetical protein
MTRMYHCYCALGSCANHHSQISKLCQIFTAQKALSCTRTSCPPIMMYVVEQSCIVRSRVQTFVTATMSHARTGCDGVFSKPVSRSHYITANSMSKLFVVEYHENTSLCFICIAGSWKWAQISPVKSRSITIRKAGELQISQSLTCKHSFFDTSVQQPQTAFPLFPCLLNFRY